jgi:hypothetical protein
MSETEVESPIDTPAKQMRIFYSTLGSTFSGSMFVLKTHITSSYQVAAPVCEIVTKLPQPNWELLQASTESGYQSREVLLAQIQQLTESLHHSQVIIQTYQVIQEHTTCPSNQF